MPGARRDEPGSPPSHGCSLQARISAGENCHSSFFWQTGCPMDREDIIAQTGTGSIGPSCRARAGLARESPEHPEKPGSDCRKVAELLIDIRRQNPRMLAETSQFVHRMERPGGSGPHDAISGPVGGLFVDENRFLPVDCFSGQAIWISIWIGANRVAMAMSVRFFVTDRGEGADQRLFVAFFGSCHFPETR